MENLARITGVVCVCVFVMGLFYQMGGFDKTSKVIRFVISISVVSTIFLNMGNLSFIPDLKNTIYDNEQYKYEENFYDIVMLNTQEELESVIKNRLLEKNISYNSVKVHILEQNGNLTAEKIVVDCDKEYADEVYLCTEDIITENTEIIIGE